MKLKKFSIEESILFEDENLLAINKPYGYSSLSDRSNPENGLLNILRSTNPDLQACHRLDKETSGIWLLAKNKESYRKVSLLFQNRQIRKVYHAVSNGIQQFSWKEVDIPILKLENGIAKISAAGKESITFFNTIETFRHATYIECVPITGRMHQIRVHLAFLKSPIVSDEKYGGKPIFLSEIKRGYRLSKEESEQPIMQRVALHAYSMEFSYKNEQILKIVAPLPKDISVLIKQLRQFDSK